MVMLIRIRRGMVAWRGSCRTTSCTCLGTRERGLHNARYTANVLTQAQSPGDGYNTRPGARRALFVWHTTYRAWGQRPTPSTARRRTPLGLYGDGWETCPTWYCYGPEGWQRHC